MKQRTKATNRSHQNKVCCPRRRLLSVLVAQALSVPLAAQAVSIEVTTSSDAMAVDGLCTLREAITSINDGQMTLDCAGTGDFGTDDEVIFASSVSGSTITLTNGPISITESVAVNPNGVETTIDGNDSLGIFSSFTPLIEVDLIRLVLTGSGGAIRVAGLMTLNLTDCTLSGNTDDTSSGSGIRARNSANLTLTNTTVSDNVAERGGGVAVFDDANVVLTNSTVSGNTATNFAGGIYVSSATVTLMDSTVSGNKSGDSYGGIFAFSSEATLTNSTVSGNTALDDFGGIFTSESEFTLTNSTISGNTAMNEFGGIYVARTSTFTLMNSIIANSQGMGQDCERVAATVTAQGDSIIETDACETNAVNEDPGLMALGDYGGPTETHALMPGSPAIDAGDNSNCGPGLSVEADQRGVARDDGACDIGAYEFAETVLPIAFQDRVMGAVMNGADQWYRFDSSATQRISTQTNGFGDDTRLELYTGGDPKQPANLLADDDDSGPEDFSNIRNDVDAGTHLIRVIGNPAADPFFLRLMSAEDILAFGDTQGHFAETAIGVMSAAGITGGCGSGMYCPDEPVTRAQMALFMLRAIQGGNQSSPAATGNVFGDVGPNSFGANAIEEFSTLGITAGCGGDNYCPDDPVTREQMAIFLLRALFGAGHTPPQATQAEINQFSDIADSFARDWIVQLVDEGITGGCGDGNQFCPTDPVTRGQMAAFIQRTFDLDTDL